MRYLKIVEEEIPIYTKENKSPKGTVDCMNKQIIKKGLREIMKMRIVKAFKMYDNGLIL